MTRARYTLTWEPLSVLLDDGLNGLIEEHWEEVAVHKAEMPLAVDWERYHRLEDMHILKVLGARQNETLIGYSAFFDLPHLHYGTTPHAACDAIYVLKRHRLSGAGIGLIDQAERDFTAPGEWRRITYHDRCGIELLGPVLRKRGYVATDVTYSKMVRG
jgi:Acetyltransferase (GNAT) family